MANKKKKHLGTGTEIVKGVISVCVIALVCSLLQCFPAYGAVLPESEEQLKEQPEEQLEEKPKEQTASNTGPEITVTATEGFEMWYRKGIPLFIQVSSVMDPEEEEHPGLACVRGVLDGEVFLEETFEGEIMPIYGFETTYVLEVGDLQKSCALEVYAMDQKGNANTSAQTVYLDGTAPVIIGTGLAAGEMYGEAYEGTIQILEKNPDPESVECEIKRTDEEGKEEVLEVEEWEQDTLSGVMTASVALDRQGIYEIAVSAADRAHNQSTAAENFALDLEPPVVQLFQDLDGQYYECFSIPWSVEEMTRDMSRVQAAFFLDGKEYDPETDVSEPGLHILRGIFTDAFEHSTEKVIRFVVKSDKSILELAEDHVQRSREDGTVKEHTSGGAFWVNRRYGSVEKEQEITDSRENKKEEEETGRIVDPEEILHLVREKTEKNRHLILKYSIGAFLILMMLIIVLSLWEIRNEK